ncbi:MAG TPA: nodulation protein NfeD [Candidatus Limnocylindrales bacterium]|nr:nodulation protein NfeD [Candidatus Limnocylindrales bacterium]
MSRSIEQIGRILFAVPLVLGMVLLLAAGSPARAAEDTPRVAVLPTSGIVDAIMAGYLEDGIAKAQRDGASAVVITLDTPGGDLSQTRRIVQSILGAPLPVIVWVSPQGAHAASAGTFITLAGHVALMAPGTNIGAASPVTGSGEDIPETMERKVIEDTTALMRSITDARGRNAEWAESTVTDAEAATAAEALALGVIDGIASTMDEALQVSDGRTVSVAGEDVAVETAGAETYELAMNPLQSFLHLLSDPNIAFILITIGFYGLLYEVISPNFVTGILGAIAIILAFIGFGSLPLNIAGLLLIALGVVMFVLEFHVVSHGLLTVAGVVCFALGASALYTEPGTPTAPDIQVDPRLIFVLTGLTAAYMAFVLLIVVRWRRRQQRMGVASTALVLADGATGSVRSILAPTGVVYAAGEEWTARSNDERPLAPGTPVRVVGQEGLTLIVEPIEAPG